MNLINSLKAIAVVTSLLIASTANAQKTVKPTHMSEGDIDRELAAVLEKGRKMQELQRLYRIGSKIKKRGRCNPHWTDAQNSFTSLQRLNDQYQGRRLDRRYRQQDRTLRSTNEAARKAYHECFTAQMNRRKKPPKNGIVDYYSFINGFTNLSVELRGHTAESLKQRAEELFALKNKFKQRNTAAVATMKAIDGDVQVTRGGKPYRLRSGQAVFPGDAFATGSTGRVNIVFNEIVGNARTGPFKVDIGPNSRASISNESVTNVRNRRAQKEITLEILVERGTVRLQNPGAGFDTRYAVVTGKFTTLALGSDVIVSHYPRRSIINVKLQGGVADIANAKGVVASLRPPSQVTIRRGVIQKTRDLPFKEWVAAIDAAGASPGKVSAPPPRANPGGKLTRPDIARRAAARKAVDRMLQAMNRADGNGLLTATTGQAQRNARNSMRNSSLRAVLQRTGRPIQWRHDCVACTSDGYCGVPTEVIVDGGPGRYDAMHVVKPANGGRDYTVDRIDAWDAEAQKFFNGNRPLCEAEIRRTEVKR